LPAEADIFTGPEHGTRTRADATLVQAQADLTLISRHLALQYPDSNAGLSTVARPLSEQFVSDISSTLWLLLAAVGVVLMIACANIASLLLARAVSRGRELAMLAALGAGRSRLARQCLAEAIPLSVGGGALGVLVAAVAIRPFVVFWPGTLPRAGEVHLDGRVFRFVS
jgi:ABC-type antimicrobial peptide transport system permease subunit